VLVTAYDIIFFWVARMIMDAMHFTGKQPFDTVFIHGLVRTATGQKMSKSLGTGVDPLELIDKYGADALRFALMQMITHGQDLRYSEDRVVGARNFCNKLWNVTRFVVMNLQDAPAERIDLDAAELSLADRWILSRHHRMLALVDRELEAYNIAQAADALYEHIWSEFCDWYVELAKADLYDPPTPERKALTQEVLRTVLEGFLRALHPIMPFITEELWHRLDPEAGPIAVAPFPRANEGRFDAEVEGRMGEVQGVVTAIRTLRAALTLAPSQRAPVTIIADDDERRALLQSQRGGISGLAMVSELELLGPGAAVPANCLAATAPGAQVFLHVPGGVDVAAELARVDRQIAAVEGDRARSEKKLGNEQFVANAPAEIVAQERERLAESQEKLAQLRERRAALEGLV
jgi:valyl-tRNA synthetase